MKLYRLVVLLAYFLLVVNATIYVPWKAEMSGMNFSLGYSYLWSPPTGPMAKIAVVDFQRAVLTVIGLSAATGFLLIAGMLGVRTFQLVRQIFSRYPD